MMLAFSAFWPTRQAVSKHSVRHTGKRELGFENSCCSTLAEQQNSHLIIVPFLVGTFYDGRSQTLARVPQHNGPLCTTNQPHSTLIDWWSVLLDLYSKSPDYFIANPRHHCISSVIITPEVAPIDPHLLEGLCVFFSYIESGMFCIICKRQGNCWLLSSEAEP